MEPPPEQHIQLLLSFPFLQENIGPETLVGLLFMVVLLLLSGLISGSEVAFFSLEPKDLSELEQDNSKSDQQIIDLLKHPKKLLATILIANNLVNVAIIILSTILINSIFNFTNYPKTGFVAQVILVTFLLLLFGEVIPKVYSNRNPRKIARLMAYPMMVLRKSFTPLSQILVQSTNFIDKKLHRRSENISVDELSHALELTSDESTDEEEQKILRGIVKFGNTDVKQIMTSRVDVFSLDITESFESVLAQILESGYSRIPVYKDNFDNINGLLYVKDLLPYLDAKNNFKWQELIKPPFFVPENKKIDDLLAEIKEKKMHLAIVVDEYGGTSGIVTLEDIIEEIVGEISDEFDDDEITYSKLDDNNYIFEGKTSLNDFYRLLNIGGEEFEENKGESDSLAGFIIEQAGRIPQKRETVSFNQYTFTIETANKRRISSIKVTIQTTSPDAEES